jgi:hypothetical protein
MLPVSGQLCDYARIFWNVRILFVFFYVFDLFKSHNFLEMSYGHF